MEYGDNCYDGDCTNGSGDDDDGSCGDDDCNDGDDYMKRISWYDLTSCLTTSSTNSLKHNIPSSSF